MKPLKSTDFNLMISYFYINTIISSHLYITELQAIANDNAQYSKTVLAAGFRTNIKHTDLSAIFEDESHEKQVKDAAEVSTGTEIADMDIINIQGLAEQVLKSITEYRIQLFEYLKNRMNAIAPNLTILVGELVGARLISHAGSLMNFAKQPTSTVQILGAEKALFRALKTKQPNTIHPNTVSFIMHP